MANMKRNRLISNIVLTVVIVLGIVWVCSHFLYIA